MAWRAADVRRRHVWALYTILGRKVLGGLTPLAATNYAALWGTLMLGAVAIPEFRQLHAAQFDWRIVVSLLYLGVLGTALAFVWYYTSVQRFGASSPAFSTIWCRCSAWHQRAAVGRAAATVHADRRRDCHCGRVDGVAGLNAITRAVQTGMAGCYVTCRITNRPRLTTSGGRDLFESRVCKGRGSVVYAGCREIFLFLAV